MHKLVGMMVVKNEGNRYLKQVMEISLKFCNELVVIDDHSTDDTVDICRIFGDRVFIKDAENNWSIEWKLRDELLQFALSRNPDWIISIDADELFENKFTLESKELMRNENINLVKFDFYNMWNSEFTYRNDCYFSVDAGVRMCRSNILKNYYWNETRRHCGSIPYSVLLKFNDSTFKADTRVKHLGYMKKKDREIKYLDKILDDPKNEFYSKEVYEEIRNNNPILYNFE